MSILVGKLKKIGAEMEAGTIIVMCGSLIIYQSSLLWFEEMSAGKNYVHARRHPDVNNENNITHKREINMI